MNLLAHHLYRLCVDAGIDNQGIPVRRVVHALLYRPKIPCAVLRDFILPLLQRIILHCHAFGHRLPCLCRHLRLCGCEYDKCERQRYPFVFRLIFHNTKHLFSPICISFDFKRVKRARKPYRKQYTRPAQFSQSESASKSDSDANASSHDIL